ncbi:MFS transporter [Vitreoscilla massiliensis]|uniref:MFS transporter n=1 Tax=Vitreoscilla massiliensis TaxID=1689272 RepID=A0ABY4DXF9_9NEIS|nr:MFS transporter [Vitreoscilla massiliensis]UOO88210.1 MFS transporter [Vitreoscilla massiliensis]
MVFPLNKTASVWKICLILALGAFSMGNAKYSIIQLMPMIAADFQVPLREIQKAVVAYFWGGILGAPLFAIVCRNWNKHHTLVFLSIWCFLGNLSSSFATNAEVLLCLRFLSGMPHGAFLAFAVLSMAQASNKAQVGRYVGVVLLGVSIATVFAAPFNAWIGETQSWQSAFRFVALCDILIALLVHDFLPQERSKPAPVSVRQLLLSLHSKPVWLLLLMEGLITACVTTVWSFSVLILSTHSTTPSNLEFIATMVLAIGFLCGQVLGIYIANGNTHKSIGWSCLATLASSVLIWVFLDNYRIALIGVFLLNSTLLINILIQVHLLHIVSHSRYLVFCLLNGALFIGNFAGSLGAYGVLQWTGKNHSVLILGMVFAFLAVIAWLCLNQINLKSRSLKQPAT